MTTMFCHSCGEKTQEGACYCRKCGSMQGSSEMEVEPNQPPTGTIFI